MSVVPRPDYPRPQFRRSRWANLNGSWDFAFDDEDHGLSRGWQYVSALSIRTGRSPFTRKITVPFCFQAALSGIGDTSVHDIVWYARPFVPYPFDPHQEQLFLHFGAVDYWAMVWVNGRQVASHEGGHTPFTADITDAVQGQDNVVIVRVEDAWDDKTIPRGKQSCEERSSHIFYTRTTGIWQTVWLEPVNRQYVGGLGIVPDIDAAQVETEVAVIGFEPGQALRLTITQGEEQVLHEQVAVQSACETLHLPISRGDGAGRDMVLWSPEAPNLYDLRVELVNIEGRSIDVVDSYFGMRKIEVRDGEVYLNNHPIYQRLVLDQGYFPGGVLTAPHDADLRGDIEFAKAMGFNGARKHQKVEDPRWLYWADRLGFLVWEEMANAYQYSLDYVERITTEWQRVIRRDRNHPCIVVWVPINESSGGRRLASDPLQVEHLLALYHLTRSLDRSRLVVSNDGWELVRSDLCTIHDYGDAPSLARRYRTLESTLSLDYTRPLVHFPGQNYQGEPILVTEFGGIALQRVGSAGWGYISVSSAEEFLQCYREMVTALTQSNIVQGFCYTQLTDVEQEVNGLLTFDRKPKSDVALIRAITVQESHPSGLVDSTPVMADGQ